jgi:hypothetical protein
LQVVVEVAMAAAAVEALADTEQQVGFQLLLVQQLL